jgi:hypothetical protein
MADKPFEPPWAGKKPGDTFTFRGPNGIGKGYLDKDGIPRNMKGERLHGPGDPIDASLVDALRAKLSSGDYEPIHPLPGTGDWVPPKSIAEPLSETPVTKADLDKYAGLGTRGPSGEGRLPRGTSDDDYWNLVTALQRLYPGGVIPGGTGQNTIANSRPVADRQTLTMNSGGSSLKPPREGFVRLYRGERHDSASIKSYRREGLIPGDEVHWFTASPAEAADFAEGGRVYYVDVPKAEVADYRAPGGSFQVPGTVAVNARWFKGSTAPPTVNSQAIGDRPVTTMTNPLPDYRPLQMTNTPLTQSLVTMINQHLANKGLPPLVNTPLLGAPTQMGRL